MFRGRAQGFRALGVNRDLGFRDSGLEGWVMGLGVVEP